MEGKWRQTRTSVLVCSKRTCSINETAKARIVWYNYLYFLFLKRIFSPQRIVSIQVVFLNAALLLASISLNVL